jgi:prepilin-type N-terminal cleavage/methylation domain-containing protein
MSDLHRPKRTPAGDISGQCGFTLLEVLVSLAVMGIALTVLLQIFSADLRNIALAEDTVYASAKAAARMREILDGGVPAEDSWTESTKDGYRMAVSISEVMKDRTDNLPVKMMQVDLVIHWMKGARDKSLTFRTIKTVGRS